MNKGIFTISLDFELFWGVRDHRDINSYGKNILEVHKIVPRLLRLFEKYEVHCTWATVGFLFFNNKKELERNLPSALPSYLKKEYDPYKYIRENELPWEFHFAFDLIEKIKNTPGQEIATHTFSHFYTLEKNTTLSQFREDIRSAVSTAKQKGIYLKTIVFPRNQYSAEHIKICAEEGIIAYRGNEVSGAYKPLSREKENKFRRAIRLADAFINITGHHCHPVPDNDNIINIPASRFLRPYSTTLKYLDGLKNRRIQKGIEFAARKGLVYHLWWHPHNFGVYMEENFSFLEKVLKFYHQLNKQGLIHSQNMFEIYSAVNKRNGEI